ncbi:hypothetical protein JW926_18045 [Candidatus Sumerlaeota bacterium]|nr:hypothetical protein [Candidatus Sumerlaeota bacterium]
MGKMAVTEQTILLLVGMCYVFATIMAIIAYAIFRKSETIPSLESIVHGPLLPLATVGMIAVGTTFLAVLGILQESTISAIFGSIIGYVLGTLTPKAKQTTDTPYEENNGRSQRRV